MVFPVVMYGCESWITKKSEHWRTDAFVLWCWRRLFQVPLDSKETKPVNPKGDQPWIFIHWKGWSWNSNPLATWCEELIHWKRPWCWERLRIGGEGATEDEMAGRHHQLNEHEFEQALGVDDGQRRLACFSPWGHKESDSTEQLNWTELMWLWNLQTAYET